MYTVQITADLPIAYVLVPTYTYTPILVSVIAISIHGKEQSWGRAAFVSHVSEAARAAGEQARSRIKTTMSTKGALAELF